MGEISAISLSIMGDLEMYHDEEFAIVFLNFILKHENLLISFRN